jgi:hypothetical protein
VTFYLGPEQKVLVARAIQAGVIEAADDVVAIGMEVVRQRLRGRESNPGPVLDETWSQQFHDWVHSHSTDVPLLSDEAISRESIYESRGRVG